MDDCDRIFVMNWLFFALLAPAIYAIVVFIDKYIIEKEILRNSNSHLCPPARRLIHSRLEVFRLIFENKESIFETE